MYLTLLQSRRAHDGNQRTINKLAHTLTNVKATNRTTFSAIVKRLAAQWLFYKSSVRQDKREG